ncbi:MAG: preprotein translocase subunit SecG [Clostridia bacterium]|nr:preprotein translocase subunit SecG [Clostridia bacterium]
MVIALGIVLCILAVALITCVLLQSGKDKSLSGSITGGAAESFFGNRKSKAKEKRLSHVTTALSFVFVILVVVMYIVVA